MSAERCLVLVLVRTILSITRRTPSLCNLSTTASVSSTTWWTDLCFESKSLPATCKYKICGRPSSMMGKLVSTSLIVMPDIPIHVTFIADKPNSWSKPSFFAEKCFSLAMNEWPQIVAVLCSCMLNTWLGVTVTLNHPQNANSFPSLLFFPVNYALICSDHKPRQVVLNFSLFASFDNKIYLSTLKGVSLLDATRTVCVSTQSWRVCRGTWGAIFRLAKKP